VEKKRMISFIPGLHGASTLTDQNNNSELNSLSDNSGVNTDVNSILDDSNLL
jgi:hypothetical protein